MRWLVWYDFVQKIIFFVIQYQQLEGKERSDELKLLRLEPQSAKW